MSSDLRLVSLFSTALLGGCAVDLAFPESASIQCRSTADCPGGLECNANIQRCVKSAGQSLPYVESAAYDPPLVKEGATLRASVEVSGALGKPPVVVLDLRGSFAPMELDDAASTEGHFELTYPAGGPGVEPEGTALLLVTLTSADGTVVPALGIGSVVFDFTGPLVVEETATIERIPRADNVLRNVSALTLGTTLRVSFAMSEAVVGPPAVRVVSTDTDPTTGLPVGIALTSELAYGRVISVVTIGQVPPVTGRYLLEVVAEDLAHNVNTSTIDTDDAIVIDASAPTSPDTDTDERVVYTRVPWGSSATGGVGSYYVDGTADATEAGTVIIAYDGADADTAAELGRASADAAGRFHLQLVRQNQPMIYLAAVDGAGNVSPSVLVRDIVWTATLGGKVRASTLVNPLRYRESTAFASTLVQDARSTHEVSQAALLELCSVGTLDDAVTVGTAQWTLQSATTSTITARPFSPMAFDSARATPVLVSASATWEWDATGRWIKRCGDGTGCESPTLTQGHSLAYDAAAGATLLWGHADELGRADELWGWDGVVWRQLCASGTCGPSARGGTALAYDPLRARTLMYGGWGEGATYFGDLWEWDGRVWTPLCESSDCGPAPRGSAAMAWDTARGRLVLFGGSDDSDFLDDTWEWDGSSWHVCCEGGACGPAARMNPSLAYDSARQRIVLFGGHVTGFSPAADTWEWDGESWSRRCGRDATDVCGPPARGAAGLVYDSGRQRVVLDGGYGNWAIPAPNDTWEWDGVAWKRTCSSGPCVSPPGRIWAPLAYDSSRQRVVLLGGMVGEMLVDSDETWEFDGSTWSLLCGGATPCSGLGRSFTTMVFDQQTGETLVFGGQNDLGEWDTTHLWDGSAWSTPCDTGTCGPARRRGPGLAYDLERDEVVMFGGHSGVAPYQDTWTWNGVGWSQKCADAGCTKPTAREGHRMVYDAGRGRVVLHGISQSQAGAEETWEWDGSSWTQACGPGTDCQAPPCRTDSALSYDGPRGKVILFGGFPCTGSGSYDETWEWDGTVWVRVCGTGTSCGGLAARAYHDMVYDAALGRTLLFGGGGYAGYSSDIGSFDSGATSRVAQLLDVPFASSGAPAEGALEAIEVEVENAYGVGYPDYEYVSTPATWSAARDACAARGGGAHLATVTSAAEQLRLSAFIQTVSAWIGLEDQSDEGVFRWVDDTPVDYTHWDVSEPDGTGGADCVAMHPHVDGGLRTKFHWFTTACDARLAYVCEYPHPQTTGLALAVWDQGAWQTVQRGEGLGPDSPGALAWQTTDPLVLRRVLIGEQRMLSLAITPIAPNGSGATLGRLGVDYVEVTVRYRLPDPR